MSWKSWVVALPLIASGVLAGEALRRLSGLYPALMSDPALITGMLAWLLAALVGVALAGGMAAGLLGAGPVGLIASVLAAIGVTVTWGGGLDSVLGAAAFLVVTAWSLYAIRREMDAQVRFSPAWLGRATAGLLTGMSLAAGVAVYSGAARSVAEHGVIVPEQAWQIVSLSSEDYIGLFVPKEQQGPQLDQLNRSFQAHLRERVQQLAEPYRGFLPVVYAGLFFLLILEANRLVAFLTALILPAIFALLRRAGLARWERLTVEVERLVVG